MFKKIAVCILTLILSLNMGVFFAYAQTVEVSACFSAEKVRVGETAEYIITVPENVTVVNAYLYDNGKLALDRSSMEYDYSKKKYKVSFNVTDGVVKLSVTARYVGTALIELSEIVCVDSAENSYTAENVTAYIEVKPKATYIYTKEDLNNIRNNLSGNYALMNDIIFEEADFLPDGAFYNDGYGWQCIGSSLSSSFTGTFDGNGYKIDGLTINKADYNYIGLFGVNQGTIENLALTNLKIDARIGVYVPTAQETTSSNAKINYESKDVWTPPTGSVDDSDLSQYDRTGLSSAIAGGIIGYNIGEVYDCFVQGGVDATPVAGGIAGSNVGEIKRCYAETNASAKVVGGITGYNLNHGVVADCHTKSNLLASVLAGGICGENRSSRIESSYSLSVLDGVADLAGVSNGSYYSTLVDTYYLNNGVGDSVAQALQTEEFKELRFTNTCWDYSGDYPVLKKLAAYINADPSTPPQEPEIIKGDVNADGVVTVSDLAILKKFVAGIISHDSTEIKNPDVNSDEEVNTTDLSYLKKILAGLET